MDGTLTVSRQAARSTISSPRRVEHGARAPDPPAAALLMPGRQVLARVRTYNPRITLARERQAPHYDRSEAAYELFLDEDRQSPVLFRSPEGDPRCPAQQERHLARKRCSSPGQRVLDIGSGWGGLPLSSPRNAMSSHRPDPLGRAAQAGERPRAPPPVYPTRVAFTCADYREEKEPRPHSLVSACSSMSRIVPFQTFSTRCAGCWRRRRRPGDAEFGARRRPGVTNPWIRKYIFPSAITGPLRGAAGRSKSRGSGHRIEILRLHTPRGTPRLAPAFQGQSRRKPQGSTTSVLPHVGILPRRLGGVTCAPRITWSGRCSSRARRGQLPRRADYIVDGGNAPQQSGRMPAGRPKRAARRALNLAESADFWGARARRPPALSRDGGGFLESRSSAFLGLA